MSEVTELAGRVYEQAAERHARGRELFGRPLTLAEKILVAHLADLKGPPPERCRTTVQLHPDRVAMQDATAQMAILQFMCAGLEQTGTRSLQAPRRGATPAGHRRLAARGAIARRVPSPRERLCVVYPSFRRNAPRSQRFADREQEVPPPLRQSCPCLAQS